MPVGASERLGTTGSVKHRPRKVITSVFDAEGVPFYHKLSSLQPYHKELLAKEGITIRIKRFSPQENEQVVQNWRKYAERTGFTDEQALSLVDNVKCLDERLRDRAEKTDMNIAMCSGFNDRTWQQVKHRCVKIFSQWHPSHKNYQMEGAGIVQRKNMWTQESDDELMQLVEEHGTNWNQVSAGMRCRTSIQCREHYFHLTKYRHSFRKMIPADEHILLGHTPDFAIKRFHSLEVLSKVGLPSSMFRIRRTKPEFENQIDWPEVVVLAGGHKRINFIVDEDAAKLMWRNVKHRLIKTSHGTVTNYVLNSDSNTPRVGPLNLNDRPLCDSLNIILDQFNDVWASRGRFIRHRATDQAASVLGRVRMKRRVDEDWVMPDDTQQQQQHNHVQLNDNTDTVEMVETAVTEYDVEQSDTKKKKKKKRKRATHSDREPDMVPSCLVSQETKERSPTIADERPSEVTVVERKKKKKRKHATDSDLELDTTPCIDNNEANEPTTSIVDDEPADGTAIKTKKNKRKHATDSDLEPDAVHPYPVDSEAKEPDPMIADEQPNEVTETEKERKKKKKKRKRATISDPEPDAEPCPDDNEAKEPRPTISVEPSDVAVRKPKKKKKRKRETHSDLEPSVINEDDKEAITTVADEQPSDNVTMTANKKKKKKKKRKHARDSDLEPDKTPCLVNNEAKQPTPSPTIADDEPADVTETEKEKKRRKRVKELDVELETAIESQSRPSPVGSRPPSVADINLSETDSDDHHLVIRHGNKKTIEIDVRPTQCEATHSQQITSNESQVSGLNSDQTGPDDSLSPTKPKKTKRQHSGHDFNADNAQTAPHVIETRSVSKKMKANLESKNAELETSGHGLTSNSHNKKKKQSKKDSEYLSSIVKPAIASPQERDKYLAQFKRK